MRVAYVSACLDSSGYAEAARNYIGALSEAGIVVDVNPISFESFKSDLGILGQRINGMVKPESDAKIQIIHTTPNVFHRFHKPDKYNIGYTTWETTKLPKGWAENINLMNEVWVPCTQNVEIFRSSGVKIPIYQIPHAFNRQLVESEQGTFALQNLDPSDFIFYSIFQWTTRKNPVDMLKAYLTEFNAGDKVSLILKTYLMNPNQPEEKDRIKQAILDVKQKLFLDGYPKIILITSLLSKPQISQLHKAGSCYLSFHRNEGFGIPIAEAMLAGKPVICTNYGGTVDFVNHEVAYPISYQETPVYGMPWETYKGDQVWADINVMEARRAMRHVYNNQAEARQKGLKAQQLIESAYSWGSIGKLMKNRLEAIGI